MKKQISTKLTLFFTNNFPYNSNTKNNKKNIAFIGIGGNIGNSIKRFNLLFTMLKKDSRFSILKTSPILKNPPFGFLKQSYFYNGIIVLKTDLAPRVLLKVLQRYEYRFKRTRSFKDAPRTLDLDIIFYNNIKFNTKDLTIPHKDYKNRNSVMIPLKYIIDSKLLYWSKILDFKR
jgi:2-amino-4-hydroxy-6-hydroxymethyldihydropteridine diphosphokinase